MNRSPAVGFETGSNDRLALQAIAEIDPLPQFASLAVQRQVAQRNSRSVRLLTNDTPETARIRYIPEEVNSQ